MQVATVHWGPDHPVGVYFAIMTSWMYIILSYLIIYVFICFVCHTSSFHTCIIHNCTSMFKELCNHCLKALIASDFALILGLSINKRFNRLPDMQNNQYYLVRKTPQKMIVQWHNCGRWKHWIGISFRMQNWAPLFIHSNNLLFISFPLTKAHYNIRLSRSPEGNSDKVRMKPWGREAC